MEVFFSPSLSLSILISSLVSPSFTAWSHILRLGPCVWTSLSMSWRGMTSGKTSCRRRRRPISFFWKQMRCVYKITQMYNNVLDFSWYQSRAHCVHFCVFCVDVWSSLTDFTWRILWQPKPEEGTWEVAQKVPEPSDEAGAASPRYWTLLLKLFPHWTASCGHLNRHRAAARPERDAAASRWNLRLHSSRAAQVRPLVNLKADNSLSAQAWRKGKRLNYTFCLFLTTAAIFFLSHVTFVTLWGSV